MSSVLMVAAAAFVGFGSVRADPAAAACEPIAGLRQLLVPGRILLLGELHGTRQSPQFALDVACHAGGAGLDVVVGLELLPRAQRDVDLYLASTGDHSDRQALLSGTQWQRGYQDGRTSRAMADLLGGLARLRRHGRTLRVALFDAQPPGGGQSRERAMAANLAASFERSPNAMHVVLTGNAHSRVVPGRRGNPDYEPMGYLLSRSVGADRVTALDVSHGDGSAWICAPECGAVQLRGHGGANPWTVEMDERTRPAGHHGSYSVGSIAASSPATSDAATALPLPAPSTETPRPQPVEPFPEQTAALLAPLQGAWNAYQYGSRSWSLEVDQQRFRGVVGPDDWYEGTIRVRTDTEPDQIDFIIEECRCDYRGLASKAIFRVEEDSIVLAAPQPGSARPARFNPNDGRMVVMRRSEPGAAR